MFPRREGVLQASNVVESAASPFFLWCLGIPFLLSVSAGGVGCFRLRGRGRQAGRQQSYWQCSTVLSSLQATAHLQKPSSCGPAPPRRYLRSLRLPGGVPPALLRLSPYLGVLLAHSHADLQLHALSANGRHLVGALGAGWWVSEAKWVGGWVLEMGWMMQCRVGHPPMRMSAV